MSGSGQSLIESGLGVRVQFDKVWLRSGQYSVRSDQVLVEPGLGSVGSDSSSFGSGWVLSDEVWVSLTWIVLLADLMSIDSASSRATIGAIIAAI